MMLDFLFKVFLLIASFIWYNGNFKEFKISKHCTNS